MPLTTLQVFFATVRVTLRRGRASASTGTKVAKANTASIKYFITSSVSWVNIELDIPSDVSLPDLGPESKIPNDLPRLGEILRVTM